ncbi:MAG: dipeptidase [Acidobacteriota bacterium]
MNRRLFLQSAALTAAGVFGPRAPGASSAQPSAEVDQLFDRAVVFDALSADQDWDAATFEAAKVAGLTALHTSLENRNFAVAMRDLAEWNALFAKHPDRLIKVTTGGEVSDAKKTGRIAVVLGFQNATIVESDVRNLDKLHAAGARCIQLTYNSRNLLGDGCTERTNAGLSDFGVDVVHRMNALGIVVDLSHCGEQTSKDGIELSKRAPAFTHTVCKAIYNHVRGKSDELIRAISNKGGVTGITTLGYFVGPTSNTSLDDYLRHLDHAVKVGGIDHVGIASDHAIRGILATHTRESWYVPRLTAFKPVYNVRWPPNIAELDAPTRYRAIARGLGRRGYSAGQIEKLLGGNWMRYFGEALSH